MTAPACIEASCDQPARGAGRCGRHYFAWRNAGEPETPPPPAPADRPACRVDGCERPVKGLGCCNAHWLRLTKTGDVQADKPLRVVGRTGCDVEACDRKHYSLGLCRRHHERQRKHGTTDLVTRTVRPTSRKARSAAPPPQPGPPAAATTPADHQRPKVKPGVGARKVGILPPPIPTGLDGILTTTSCPKHAETALEPWPKPADLPSWLEAVRRLNTALHHYATGCTEQLTIDMQPVAGAGVPTVARRTA